jgi:DNA helicase-2/ATP-dependent DNA helicase PcrA
MTASPSGHTRKVELNAAQRAAVEHLHGPMLVVAGAGTGKTRVITERILYLLQAIPELEGENILAVTFTKKAAAEMKARVRRRGDKRAERVEVRTFHSFCYHLLQQHQEALQVLDEIDYWIFLRRRLDRLRLKVFRKLSEPGRFLGDFTDFFSRCQDELISPDEYSNYVADLREALGRESELLNEEEREERAEELARQEELARVYATAEELLREANRTTYGGSLFSAVELLRANAALREHYQEKYRYILVDEFQDTNIAQIELLRLLTGRHRNLMAVGDDDQAIYRFRGASYASFKKFTEIFPDHSTTSLTQNYRSTARILGVASTLIAQNGTARFDQRKKLLPELGGGEKVRLAEVEDAAEEAAYVRGEIERLHQKLGCYDKLAVLYRSHVHRDVLVDELTRAGIPFVIRGLSILRNTLVRDLLAYLRAIVSPEDNISLARLLAIPAWGLTPTMLLDLVQRARRERQDGQARLLQAVATLHPRVRDEQTRLGGLLQLLEGFRARAGKVGATELFEELIERLQLRLLPSDPDRPYLDALTQFLRQWEGEKSESKRLAEFVEYLNYFEEAGASIDLPEEGENRDAVQLMTVHGAKGLEFDAVFVLRVNQSDFPTRRRQPLFEFPPALMKEALPPGDFRIQEERRLCYVALTRARRRLALTTLTGRRKKPSVFLDDILRNPHAARDVLQLAPDLESATEAAPGPEPAAHATTPGQATLFPVKSTDALYSRIARWAGRPLNEKPEEPLTLSHSALETYLKCPLKYKFSYLWKLPSQATPAMAFGQIMHRSVAEYFRARGNRRKLPFSELNHIYEQEWRKTAWPSGDSYQQEEYYASGQEQLRAFFEQTQEEPPAVLEIEKSFAWPWEDVVITGRIDQINRVQGKRVEIVEYKTGEPRPPRTVEKSYQLALYAQAVEHQLGLRPERLTLYNFTANQAISFSPDESNTKRMLDKAREVVAGIRANDYAAKSGYHCRYCDYQKICPAFERLPSAAAASESDEEGEIEN